MQEQEQEQEQEILSPLSPGAKEAMEKRGGLRKKRGKSREICSCGHPVNSHKVMEDGSGRTTCTPGRTACGCIEILPIITTDNLRFFLFGTTGMCYGLDHALSKGILLTEESDDFGYQWLSGDEAVCGKCSEVTPFPIPVAIDRITGKLAMDGSIGNNFNRILCQGCFIAWTTPSE